MRIAPRKNPAFSLVELSIVLVILGLLVGGILAGQSLIRASELRSVTIEHDRYRTAVSAFRDKYFALPGDMTNATVIWGKSAATCNTHTGTAATPGTCNGNGDSQLTYAPNSAEFFRFWQQLSLAGLIAGTYSGVSSDGSSTDNGSDSTNSPASKFKNGLWAVVYSATAPNANFFNGSYGNYLEVGGYFDVTSEPLTKLFTPTELWNLDTKMDDGKPATGTMVIWRYFDCATGSGASDMNAVYNLTTTNQCNPAFRNIM